MIGLDDFCLATGGQLYGDAMVREFTGISDDPAKVRPGELFVVSVIPEAGQDADIERALASGAGGLLCEMPPTRDVGNVTTILVGDSRLGLEQWAAFIMRQYHPLTIGVVGEIGKTAVADAIAAAIGSRYPIHACSSSHRGPYRIALDVAKLEPQHNYAVFELSPDEFTGLNDLASILQPQILVFSSMMSRLAADLETPFNLPETVAQLVAKLPAKGTIVANAQDYALFSSIKADSVRLLTYDNDLQPAAPPGHIADVVAEQVSFGVESFSLNLRASREIFKELRFQGAGAPALNSALAAVAVCLPIDLPVRDALAVLGNKASMGGISVSTIKNGVILAETTANATPETVHALFDWLDQLGDQVKRRLLILASLGKGGDRQLEHCHAIGRRAAMTVDALVSCDVSTASAVLAARRAGMAQESTFIPRQRDEALAFMADNLGVGDIVIAVAADSAAVQPILKMLAAAAGKTPAGASQPAQVAAPPAERSWLEIDRDALAANITLIKRQLQNGTGLTVVVKDDAYRHGLVEVGWIASHNGAEMLAVSTVQEGLALREAGIDLPLLVTGHNPADSLGLAISSKLMMSIHSRTHAELVAQASRRMKARASCHIQVSCAPRDAGVPVGEIVALVREIRKADQLVIDGLFVEFSPVPSATWANDSARQLQQFAQVVRNLSAAGVDIPHIHAAGSAVMLSVQNGVFSTARIGHLVYGISPFATMQLPNGLRPALSWKTSIADIIVEQPKRGAQTPARRLGVIPVGYRDGLARTQRGQASVLTEGGRAALTDMVGPGWAYIDITAVAPARIGSEVVLIGTQGNQKISIEEIAAQRNGASYDVISSLPSSLHRVYSD